MEFLSNFSERLKELLFENKISPEQLANAVNVSRTTAYRWTLEPLQITRANLISVADYFHCTLEFLIGRSESDIEITPKPCPDFSTQVRKVMKEKGFTTYSLRKKSRFDGTYFHRWKAGEEPLLPTLLELSSIFDCTLDYLIGRER